jgi:transposase
MSSLKSITFISLAPWLLCDNASPRRSTATSIRAMLENFNWELFDYLPYSPDIAPSGYHLFSYLKNRVGS